MKNIDLTRHMKRIGLVFSNERCKQNLSQQALADLAGVSRSTVVRLEAGESVQYESMYYIATALGKKPIDLIPPLRLSSSRLRPIADAFKRLTTLLEAELRDDTDM